MRLSLDELAARLEVSIGRAQHPNIILVNGNEPLLVEEALNDVRQVLKSAGFDERLKYQLETGFDWSQLNGTGQSMSLFSHKRVIEFRVPNKLGAAGTKALTEYCNNLPEHDLLIVLMPYLDKRQRDAKWAKIVDSVGWIADSPEITVQQFPGWLKMRLQSRALRVEPGVVEMLGQQTEGNVMAAAQEIDKLQVLAKDGAVTLKLLTDSLADQARFDVYALTDASLQGDFQRALRIQRRLQSEGLEPVVVVWALVREIRLMAQLSSGLQAGQNRNSLFKQNRIWSKREPTVNAALNRTGSVQWHKLLERAAHLDQTVKGQRAVEVGPVWYQIEKLCAAVCGLELVKHAC